MQCDKEYKKSDITKINKYAKEFYTMAQEGLDKLNKLYIDVQCVSNNQEIIEDSINYNNTYFPSEIRLYIEKNDYSSYKFVATIKGIPITVYFFNYLHYSNELIVKYSKLVFFVILILDKNLRKSCTSKLEIKIFLTPYKKLFPPYATDIIGPSEVNTGFSTLGCSSNGSITIYRQEEWLKVVIHELFHNLDLDFSSMKLDNIVPFLYKTFGVNSTYQIYETYTEFWARILNIVIVSFLQTSSYKQYLELFHQSMSMERLFSLMQASLIIDRITTNTNYKEESNVLCYYVFTAALFDDYLKFFEWCKKNNTSLFDFKKTKKNLRSFTELLISQSSSSQFRQSIQCIKQSNKEKESVSLRMTVIDLDF